MLTGLALLAGCSAALCGCKGNSTSAAFPERFIPAPLPVTVSAAAGDVVGADPLSSDVWVHAKWLQLIAPANTLRTTLPTQAALLYDSNMLYAAFICDRSTDGPRDETRDVVTFYLDTTEAGRGSEMVKVSVDAAGQASSSWVRVSDPPAKAREDGSPNLDTQIFTIPNVKIAGLWIRVEEGKQVRMEEGKEREVPVWAAVVGVPVKKLPQPLQTTINEGSQWKFNLIRTVMVRPDGEQLQANWSPVYVGEQEFAPYRMAKLVLGQ